MRPANLVRAILPAGLVTACLVGVLACSGTSSSSSTPKAGSGDGSADATSAADSEDQKIRRAQLATCGPMCERLIDCSVEDLRANKTEQEIAEMQLDQLVPRAVDDCNTQCSGSNISPRQIRVVQECVNGPESCEDYLTCLDKAQRGG